MLGFDKSKARLHPEVMCWTILGHRFHVIMHHTAWIERLHSSQFHVFGNNISLLCLIILLLLIQYVTHARLRRTPVTQLSNFFIVYARGSASVAAEQKSLQGYSAPVDPTAVLGHPRNKHPPQALQRILVHILELFDAPPFLKVAQHQNRKCDLLHEQKGYVKDDKEDESRIRVAFPQQQVVGIMHKHLGCTDCRMGDGAEALGSHAKAEISNECKANRHYCEHDTECNEAVAYLQHSVDDNTSLWYQCRYDRNQAHAN
mmetsp:Transcript_133030/g.331996  ORF Transcript_133030/g.331996 Transcript_133030/m.331996 type:complete len:259 (+) Transcript_133030:3192-3968(+)